MLAPRTAARAVLGLLASGYLAGIWLDGVGSGLPADVLPEAVNYFLQVAALFPHSATMSIDYRAEGWVCAERQWREIDTRVYFRLDGNDKESRFQRVMHFFRDEHRTMHALDDYLVRGHAQGDRPDGIEADRTIGGVRFTSLRIPIPAPGETVRRFVRLPLSDYPADEHHMLYHTPKSLIAERCGARE
jgi:hypothetical protein